MIFEENDLFSYKLDYEIMSSLTKGAKNKGSIYLKGVKGKEYDNFVFSLDKNTDFVDLEITALVKVYENAFKSSGRNSQKNPP